MPRIRSFINPARPLSLFSSLVAIMLVIVPPLQAEDQEEQNQEIRRTRVIKVAGPEGHAVAHGLGTMGSRGYLGVEAIELSPELRLHFGGPEEIGVMISRVEDDSPAQRTGLQVGDLLTTVDNQPIQSFVDLFHEISSHEEGDVVRLEAWRDAQFLSFDATLTKLERPQIDIRRFHIGEGDEHHAMVLSDGDFDEVIELQTEAFDEAIVRLNEEMSSANWQERIHSFSSNREELLERLEALENRLRELEGDLEDAGSDER